jgi:hypothetical protein
MRALTRRLTPGPSVEAAHQVLVLENRQIGADARFGHLETLGELRDVGGLLVLDEIQDLFLPAGEGQGLLRSNGIPGLRGRLKASVRVWERFVKGHFLVSNRYQTVFVYPEIVFALTSRSRAV